MTRRFCEHCGGWLGVTARRDARFCTPKCRAAAHRRRASIPEELRAAGRWTRRDGKRPITCDGWPASSTRWSTWASYDEVAASNAGDGIGFMLGGGFACIDLDHCMNADGTVSALAQEVLDDNPDAWVELSMSGTGLHVWGLLPEGPGYRRGGLEVYSQGRFIALGEAFRSGGLHRLNLPAMVG